MELNICHLYPDILNLYGDRGNILCMRKRLAWRGIDVNVDEVSIGQKLEASKYDLLFIGGGQDFEQEVLLPDLRGAKTEELKAAIEDNLPVPPRRGTTRPAVVCWKTSRPRATPDRKAPTLPLRSFSSQKFQN